MTLLLRQRPVAKLALVGAAAVCSALGATSGAAVAGTHAAASSRPAVSSGTWGTAQKIPGLAALNKNGFAEISSVSCASAGNCSAGGHYGPASDPLAFVADETNGTWGRAKKVAGLQHSPFSEILTMSCGSPGNCSAGGDAGFAAGPEGFVVTEVSGTWGTAHLVTLSHGTSDVVSSVSCASAGNCGAGGLYANGSVIQAYVVDEVNGTWGTAQEVPGIAALDQGGIASVRSVSCASPGNCSAGGDYELPSGIRQVFVVDEVNGVWDTAQEVPGIAALNKGDLAHIFSVSCASPGNCSAGGDYHSRHARVPRFLQAFVVNEVNGVWGKAEAVPGTTALNKGNNATVSSLSCAPAGNCGAGGFYGVTPATSHSEGTTQAFVASEVNGVWGKAEAVPGIKAPNKGGGAGIDSVSCAPAGNCGAGGYYIDGSGHAQAFVASEVNGVWGKAETVPGTKALNKGGDAGISSVSCAPAGRCSAGGFYIDGSGHNQAFVVGES